MSGGDDIVARLRLAATPETVAHVFTLTVVRCSLMREAADEIERLRAENDALQEVCHQAKLDDAAISLAQAFSVEPRREFGGRPSYGGSPA